MRPGRAVSRPHERAGHAVEELRFIRPDVAVAVVKTLDIRRAGVPTTGEETRGLIILSKEDGHWKVNALENTEDSGNTGRPSLDGHCRRKTGRWPVLILEILVAVARFEPTHCEA